MNIKELDKSTFQKWNDFVMSRNDGTFFHLAEWKKVIEECFGHKTYFLYAEFNGEIRGIYPLGHVKSLLFGNSLISLPFCVYGGALADSRDSLNELNNSAVRLATDLNVDYLENRNLYPSQGDWKEKDLYVTFRKEISPDHDSNMNAIPRKQRAMVRKGLSSGMAYEIDETVDRLFNAYSESVRNLGTPVFSKKYFRVLKETFKDQCEILTVLHNRRVVSSVMSFYFKNEVLPYYGGGTFLARQLKANDYMYWQVMCRAADKGVNIFDYGRSKRNTGSYSFKKNWGFEPTPLQYSYKLINSSSIPDISPANPKYQLFIKCWKRLPLVVSKWIGPHISRNLG